MSVRTTLGTVVLDEIVFGINRVHLRDGMVLVEAETEIGTREFPGGEADCEVFGEDGRPIVSVRMHVPPFDTWRGVAYMTLPIHITEATSS